MHSTTRAQGIAKKQSLRSSLTLAHFQVDVETGLSIGQFDNLYQHLLATTSLVRDGSRNMRTVMSTRVRLLMVLHWLREKPKFRILAQKFHVSIATVYRDVAFFLPKLIVATRGTISWPKQTNFGWEGTIGSIDCTAHLRTRVHPRQAEFYRRDKGFLKRRNFDSPNLGFNIMAQLVVGSNSHIYQVNFLTGHNNDAGAFKITGMNRWLQQEKVKLLADGGKVTFTLLPLTSM